MRQSLVEYVPELNYTLYHVSMSWRSYSKKLVDLLGNTLDIQSVRKISPGL